jgi:hypothetical protein
VDGHPACTTRLRAGLTFLTRVRALVVASALWTLFVWGTRVRNIGNDETMGDGEKAFAYVVSVVFIGAAIAMVALLVTRRFPQLRGLLPLFAIATVGWWAVRSVFIVVHDHSTAFRVVHIVLAIISAVLAVAAWLTPRVRS